MTSPSVFRRVCLCSAVATSVAAFPSPALVEATGAIVPALSGELGVARADQLGFAWQLRAGVGGRYRSWGSRTILSGGALAGLYGDGDGVSAAVLGRLTLADRRRFALLFGEAGPFMRLSGPSSLGGLAALTLAHWLGPQLSIWGAYGTGGVHAVGVTAGVDLLRAVFALYEMTFPGQ